MPNSEPAACEGLSGYALAREFEIELEFRTARRNGTGDTLFKSLPWRWCFHRAVALLRGHRGWHPIAAPDSIRNVSHVPVTVS